MEKQLSNGTSQMDHLLFNKLDELLSQTQLYSEFLLEKMDDITFVSCITVFDILKCTSIILPSQYSRKNMFFFFFLRFRVRMAMQKQVR
jgi:hypothetical protein